MAKLNNTEICSNFIEGNMFEYENKYSNMSFKGKNIWSYDSHLATADRTKKVLYIEKSISHYSNSSSKQAILLRANARKNNYLIVEVYDTSNVQESYLNDIKEFIIINNRARSYDYRPEIMKIIKNLLYYIENINTSDSDIYLKKLIELKSLIKIKVKK